MFLCVCKYARICMQVPTATSLAWSHEVNPGGWEHQLRLRGGCLGQTSAVCVDVAAPEREALQPGRVEVPVLWEPGGEEEGAVEEEGASPLCACCLTLLQTLRDVGCDGSLSRYACVSDGFGLA